MNNISLSLVLYRDDIHCASTATAGADVNALLARLEKQLVDVDRAEQRHKQQLVQQKQFQKKMMQEAVGKLYSDKREVVVPSAADNFSEIHEPSLTSRIFGSAMNCPLPAFLQLVAMVIAGFLSRLLSKQQAKAKEL